MKKQTDFTIYSDGGSRGNPGEAAYGYVIYDKDGSVFHKEGKRLGHQTNNYAEYMGIIKAFEYITKNTSTRPLNVACFLDSMLVAQQMSGNWKIKHENIRNLYFTAQQLAEPLGEISYSQIPRAQNKEADKLVNMALDGELE